MGISKDDGHVIEFNTSWTMADIDGWLHHLLPKPFAWLNAQCGKPTLGEYHWVLLNSQRFNYFVLTHPTITGEELDEVKGPSGHKYTDYSIVISESFFLMVQNMTSSIIPFSTSTTVHPSLSMCQLDHCHREYS